MPRPTRYVFEDGEVCGKLIVQKDLMNGFCLCKCECGTEKQVAKVHLKSGKIVSCGCWNKTKATKHGMEKSIEYTTWAQMLSRCRNPNNKMYHHYGGRGIKVCERWHDFVNFYEDMGNKPKGYSLDRIDNNADYSPENCKWSSTKDQIRNRRVTPKYEWNGKVYSLAELSEMHVKNSGLVAMVWLAGTTPASSHAQV